MCRLICHVGLVFEGLSAHPASAFCKHISFVGRDVAEVTGAQPKIFKTQRLLLVGPGCYLNNHVFLCKRRFRLYRLADGHPVKRAGNLMECAWRSRKMSIKSEIVRPKSKSLPVIMICLYVILRDTQYRVDAPYKNCIMMLLTTSNIIQLYVQDYMIRSDSPS